MCHGSQGKRGNKNYSYSKCEKISEIIIYAMKKIGLFGGTFNPVHIGHITMAEAARKEYKLSCVYFIPCGVPPHKSKTNLLPAETRFELIKSAIKQKKYFKALDVEINKKKPCYTVDTVKKLIISNLLPPVSQLYFLIGQDEFENLHTWRNAKELVKLVTFLVLPRYAHKIKPPKIKDLQWSLVHTKLISISSTEIRKEIKKTIALLKLKDMPQSP